MIFKETSIAGAWTIDLEKQADERGYFARACCEAEFASRHLCTRWPQHNLSVTRGLGMIRGLHYQVPPAGETKVVRCFAGRAWDVIVDLRPGSSSFGRWTSVELDAAAGNAVYIPVGCAHGFQSLTDECVLYYLMGESYSPAHARGIRWDDPTLAIAWPLPGLAKVGGRDGTLPSFDDAVRQSRAETEAP